MGPRRCEASWNRHTLCRFVVIFASWFLCGQAWAQDGRGIGAVGRGLDKTTEGGHHWALVIGINDYTNLPRLNYARQDAKALVNALVQAGFDRKNIVLMTDDTGRPASYPTRGNLRARINQIAQTVGPNDVLLIFFSGHGAVQYGEGHLVPVDGDTNDLYSLVPLSWVRQTLEGSAAKHRLLILDACHSGAKSGDAANSSVAGLYKPLAGAAFATMCSCDVDQLSYEDDEAKRGVFTGGVIDGLRGFADREAEGNRDGVVTASELWAYASLHTLRWGLKFGKTQTPVLKGRFKGRIELARFLIAPELSEPRAAREERPTLPASTLDPYLPDSTTVEIAPSVFVELILMPAQEFKMGTPRQYRSPQEGVLHHVRLAHPFYIGKYEVTQGQWKAVSGDNPSFFKRDDRRPVESVSWEQAQSFLDVASDFARLRLRLPTEAEWECACRYDEPEPMASTLTTASPTHAAWYGKNSGNTTHAVGKKMRSASGLHDMFGNVAEWCQDYLGELTEDATEDPTGPKMGERRVVRGGAWDTGNLSVFSPAYRDASYPTAKFNSIGFRAVLEIPEKWQQVPAFQRTK